MTSATRLGRPRPFVAATLLLCGLVVAGCGGSRATLPQPAPAATAAPAYTGPLADATFRIRVPGPTSSSLKRRPAYVSQATASIKFTLASPPGGFNQPGAFNVTPGSGNCPASGADYICTLTIRIPPGSDTVSIVAYAGANGTGSILSGQIQTFSVIVAAANTFNVVLDANIVPSGAMTVSANGFCQSGPVGSAYGIVGTTPQTFTVTYTDAASKPVTGPGLPKLQIQDNAAVFQSTSGTINGTGGTVAFAITQGSAGNAWTQTFTLTPSNSSTTNAAINVRAVQADSNTTSDGLSFTTPVKSFTFATGAAPPAHNFLALVEQFTASTGRVDFFNVGLGGSTGPDTLSAYPAANFLAQTTSTNQPSQQDVDGPVSLLWDNTGDLLIGNGDTTGGNLACVPVGAIATGASSATTVTTNIDDPVGLAYEPRNGTVAVGNNPANAPQNLAEYVLTGNYTPSANNLKVAGVGSGLGSIQGGTVNVPTLPVGTFAIALRNGCEVDVAHQPSACTAISKIAILSPTGVETDITNPTSPVTFAIDQPTSLAWDANASQFVIANNTGWHPSISFYSAAGAQQKVVTPPGPQSPSFYIPYLVSTSPDGHVAVAWTTPVSGDQVQIYDNTVNRNPIGGPIPYNSTTTACGSTYTYGPGAIPTSITWLSNTKFLVSLQAFTAGAANATNGLYIYDYSTLTVPSGFDDVQTGCPAFAAAPTQTGFHPIATNKPLATAFKP